MKKRIIHLLPLLALVLSGCTLSFGSTLDSSGTNSDSSDETSGDTSTDTSSSSTSNSSSSTSTSAESSSSSSTSTSSEETWDNYYRPSVVDPNFKYQDLQKAGSLNSIPTPGTDINILVIPIEFTNYTFSTKTITDINTLFTGTATSTNYWESVTSFYTKSSYGNLNLDFTVAPKYVTGYTPQQAANLNTSSTQYFSTNLLRNAVSNYKSTNGNASTQQFDSDSDGYIDAVWMVYSCPNYSNSATIENISTDFWAYVFWDYTQASSVSSPNSNAYGWASYDFMYEGGGTSKVDGHTYIHETGHLLGLDDYYNYDENSSYKPTGGIDMMDYNVTDHNVWSKMALGWLKPYVVTGNAEITINPAESSGDAILIADDWNGTSFDEFLMLELYTPTGLNKLDSDTAYTGSYPRGYTQAGVRLYHIDSRLGEYNYSGNFLNYGHPTGSELYNNSTSRYYGVANSNTPSYSANSDYRLIHMIQARGTNTFDTGSTGVNADLFTTGKSFSMAANGSQFFENGSLLNNGNALGYTIQFVSVSSTSATIRITKI